MKMLTFHLMSFFLLLSTALPAQWTLAYSTPEVDVYEQMEVIDDMANGVIWEFYNFRYENKTASAIQLDWYFEVDIDDQCSNCDGGSMDEYTASLLLAANESYTCNPMAMADRRRVITRRVVNQNTQVVTDYEIRNFTATPQ